MKYTLGFIGCGNMGGALVQAAAKRIDGNLIAVCDHHAKNVQRLQAQFGVVSASAQEIAEGSQFVILGVKPQAIKSTVAEISSILRARTSATLVTMAAGVSIAALQKYVGDSVPVIRIMPNTPVAVGAGMVLYATSGVSNQAEETFLSVFSKAGLFDKLPEEKIDVCGVLSGCSPAFVYVFAESLAAGGVECGVSREKAALYSAQALYGAAKMLLTYGNPAELKEQVCSPGGTTIAGIHAMESGGFRGAIMSAVTAAHDRTLALKK